MFTPLSAHMSRIAVVLAPLLSIVIFSGTPCRPMARLKKHLATDLDIRFIHSPARTDRALAPPQDGGKNRHHLDRPPMNRGVIDHHPTLGHHLFDLSQAQRVRRLPANAHQHHLNWVVQPLQNPA